MTRTRITVIVAGTVAAVAALTWVIAAPARQPTAPGAAAPAAAPTDSTWPLFAGATSAAAPASPAPSGSGTPAAPPATTDTGGERAVAEPFVQSFAGQPGVKPLKPVPSPTRTVSVAVNIDGCDHAYGLPSQCIPGTFPAGITDKCAWLAAHGFTELPVVAADRQQLDPDGNRIACDN